MTTDTHNTAADPFESHHCRRRDLCDHYAALAEAAGISQPTAKVWVNLLQSLGVVTLLPPRLSENSA